jgi:hypothetical protein
MVYKSLVASTFIIYDIVRCFSYYCPQFHVLLLLNSYPFFFFFFLLILLAPGKFFIKAFFFLFYKENFPRK